MKPHSLRYLRVLGAIVVLCATPVACSDDEKPTAVTQDTLEQIQQATFRGGSAAYAGETRFADGSAGPVDGLSQADPPAGQVSYPVLTEGGPKQVTVRWVDGNIYTERAVTTDADAAAGSTTLRLESDRPWTRVSYQPLATAQYDAYDPFRLLERLSALNLRAASQGTEDVDGVQLDRYTVDVSSLGAVAPGRARTIELLTDRDRRLQVARLIGDDRIEYTIDDYGAEVAPTPPTDDQIGVATSRPAIERTGPYEVVAQGISVEAGAWQLGRAPATDGGTCWRLDTTASLDPVAATEPDGGTCIMAFDPTGLPDDQVQVVVDAGSGASFDAVVAAVAGGSSAAELQFTDRSRQPLAVDPGGFVVWIGPKAPLAAVLEVTAPDGAVVSCGPGVVSSLEDLEDLPPEELDQLDRLPWLCLAL